MTKCSQAGPNWLRVAGETALGIILAIVPLALWVSWSPEILIGVIAAGGVCAALLVMLWGRSGVGRVNDAGNSRAEVSDLFVQEMHKLFPLTYHHSRRGKLRYRRTMERLRRALK